MNREAVLLEFYRDRVRKLKAEVEQLVASPAKYLDVDRSIEPSSGIPLYDRLQRLRADFSKDFPSRSADLPEMKYHLAQGQTLERSDLVTLVRDLMTLGARIPESDPGSTGDERTAPAKRC